MPLDEALRASAQKLAALDARLTWLAQKRKLRSGTGEPAPVSRTPRPPALTPGSAAQPRSPAGAEQTNDGELANVFPAPAEDSLTASELQPLLPTGAATSGNGTTASLRRRARLPEPVSGAAAGR